MSGSGGTKAEDTRPDAFVWRENECERARALLERAGSIARRIERMCGAQAPADHVSPTLHSTAAPRPSEAANTDGPGEHPPATPPDGRPTARPSTGRQPGPGRATDLEV